MNLLSLKLMFHTGILALLTWPSLAMAQSQKTDIRPNANQVLGDDIVKLFEGKTHHGSYNFNDEGVARNDYIETHKADGRSHYNEGDLKSDGIWYIGRDNLCFVYENEDMNGGCFRVYRINNCFYYYSSQVPQRDDELDRDYWTARSTLEGEIPDCDPVIG
ncbi:MAG: hypothetical protein ABJG88_10185 [Litorimonas sp.]